MSVVDALEHQLGLAKDQRNQAQKAAQRLEEEVLLVRERDLHSREELAAANRVKDATLERFAALQVKHHAAPS